MTKVNILISTIDEGIDKTADVLLSPRNDVRYIISHQYTDERYNYTPKSLLRSDVYLSHIQGAGVTRSRNNALTLADGAIGLFADDDVRYRHSDIDTLKRTFYENSSVDVAIFKIRTPSGEPEYKQFPAETITYDKAPDTGTVQIAFNIARVKEKGIWFDERFGAGRKLLIGSDERLFLHDCINAGLKVRYFPEYIVEHPYESTAKGIPKYDIRKNWVTGAVDCRMNGPIALLKALAGTLKILPDLLKNKMNPMIYFYHRISAVIYILRTNGGRHGR